MQRGDHLVSSRIGYTHHGLYLGQQQVIHYTGLSNDNHSGQIEITNLETFSTGKGCSVMPAHLRLYDAEESIARAYQRLGENNYNLLFNNCEHFVTWCLYGLQTSQQVNKAIASGIAIHALASGAALPALKEAARHTTDKLQQEGVVRLASHAASAPACMGKTAISTTVGLAAGAGISTGAGSVLATGLVAASAAPLALTVATGAVVGYGVSKLIDWAWGD